MAVRAGDEIIEVDGRRVDPVHGPWRALAARGQAGGADDPPRRPRGGPVTPKPLDAPDTDPDPDPADPDPAAGNPGSTATADLASPAGTAEPADADVTRRVVMVPLPDERPLRYQDWVATAGSSSAPAPTGGSATCMSPT